MKEIKMFKGNVIGKDVFGIIVMLDSTGEFNPLSIGELYELIHPYTE